MSRNLRACVSPSSTAVRRWPVRVLSTTTRLEPDSGVVPVFPPSMPGYFPSRRFVLDHLCHTCPGRGLLVYSRVRTMRTSSRLPGCHLRLQPLGQLQVASAMAPLPKTLNRFSPMSRVAHANRSCCPVVCPEGIFSDGALTTRTAALREPYCDAPTTGLLTWPPERLRELIRRASASGWHIATHAIGDRAIDAVLDALEAAREGGERDSRRHRIEHCTILDRMALARIKSLAIVPVLQPEDIAVLGDAYEPALGPERAANNSPVGWFEEEEIPIAFSSDRPVTPGNPLVGIRAAVERRTASGRVLGPAHQISGERAVMHYTGGAAYATHTETVKGCLAPGMLADMVVLDRDITSCPSEEITEARVTTTIVDGRPVFPAAGGRAD